MVHLTNSPKLSIHPIKERFPGLLEKIGYWQIRGSGYAVSKSYPLNTLPQILSPLHGRSVTLLHPEFGYLSIKGVGWTIGPVSLHRSPKDQRLYFGLYSVKDGMREWAVSAYLESHHVSATRVYGLASFNPVIETVVLSFKDGSFVDPALLYVHSVSPWRVADLPWMDASMRSSVIEEVSRIRGWRPQYFVMDFCEHLAQTMAQYHRLGCINDSLSPDNVTLAGEITDFEWFMAPGHPLPDGSQAEDSSDRRRKEIIYAYEIGCMLAHGLGKPDDAGQVVSALTSGYRDGDKECAHELSCLLAASTDGSLGHALAS